LPKLPCARSVPQLTLLLSMAAEKVTSLGKDWHRPCLRCEKCNKTLTSGGHAEHDGKPYCNHPCYAALFGPKGECLWWARGGAQGAPVS
ncbi:CRIP1 protein, partial [Cercotrichas coryphoeus]|nr:CRIP1 protein [Cercotrichas coryphoeus]